MKRASIIAGVLLLVLLVMSQAAESVSNVADKQASEEGKGTTVEDLGRGLKNAAHNVEKEIPKIGSAIGKAFKKITGKSSEKKSDQESPKEKK